MTVAGRGQLLPVRSEELAGPVVVPPAFAEEVLALDADLAIARFEEGFPARPVLGERAGQQLVEIELSECVVRSDDHRLRGAAFAPLGPDADHDPGRPVRVQPIDAGDAGRADGLPVR